MTTQCIITFIKRVTQNRQNSRPGETYPYEEYFKFMPNCRNIMAVVIIGIYQKDNQKLKLIWSTDCR